MCVFKKSIIWKWRQLAIWQITSNKGFCGTYKEYFKVRGWGPWGRECRLKFMCINCQAVIWIREKFSFMMLSVNSTMHIMLNGWIVMNNELKKKKMWQEVRIAEFKVLHWHTFSLEGLRTFNPLNTELNPICQ